MPDASGKAELSAKEIPIGENGRTNPCADGDKDEIPLLELGDVPPCIESIRIRVGIHPHAGMEMLGNPLFDLFGFFQVLPPGGSWEREAGQTDSDTGQIRTGLPKGFETFLDTCDKKIDHPSPVSRRSSPLFLLEDVSFQVCEDQGSDGMFHIDPNDQGFVGVEVVHVCILPFPVNPTQVCPFADHHAFVYQFVQGFHHRCPAEAAFQGEFLLGKDPELPEEKDDSFLACGEHTVL